MHNVDDEYWMSLALKAARRAADCGEVPVGAVLVRDNQLIAEGFNQPIAASDPSRHAEIDVLRRAGRLLQNYRLVDTSLYVTIEPCTMCVGALVHARVAELIFGAREPRSGAVVSQLKLLDQALHNHHVVWREGVLGEDCAALMQDFFRARRR